MDPHPKKSLGQHFLREAHTARRIVDLLRISPADNVLEIGPGPGALTGLIRERGPQRFAVIEKDDHWARVHAQSGTEPVPVEVRHADALQCVWEELSGPWKIIGNLPYNVASPLIWDLVFRVPELARAVFMVQKEVAGRLAAVPGGKIYGALSVWVQSYVRARREFTVGPSAFEPPPKVDSAVVVFEPLPGDSRPANPKVLARVLKMCFQQRRKQLQSILRRNNIANVDTILESLGITPDCRPETLSVRQFQDLSSALESYVG